MTFDIIRFYEDHKVDHTTEGKNVMPGWVNISCVFCDDTSNHLGVHINKPGNVKCWRCGSHNLMEILEHFSDSSMSELYREYELEEDALNSLPVKFKEKETKPLAKIEQEFGEAFEWLDPDNEDDPYATYLESRGFDPEQMHRDWGVKAGIESGYYKYRLMIPIYSNGQLISFQGRDITDRQEEKYLTCPGTNIHDYLYGIDYVYSDRIIITEGVTDVWRLGKGYAVATIGINFSSKQLRSIVEKGINHAIVFFDSEPQAQSKAEELVNALSMFDIECINFSISSKDPGSLDKDEVESVLKLLRSF